MKCLACHDTVQDDINTLTCGACRAVSHYQCLGMSEEFYKNNIKTLKRSWVCPQCDRVTRRRQPDRSDTPTRKRFEVTPGPARHDMSCDETIDICVGNTLNTMKHCITDTSGMSDGTGTNSVDILNKISSDLNVFRTENKRQMEEFRAEVLSTIENKYKMYDDKLNKITAELIRCTSELSAMRGLNSDLERSTKFLSTQYDDLNNKLAGTQIDVKSMTAEIKLLKMNNNPIDDLVDKINILEQRARSKNIEIFGIPETKSENLPNIVTSLAKKLNIDIKTDNIEFAVRVQQKIRTPGIPKPIIAKLGDALARDRLISAIRKQKGLTSEDLGFKGNLTKGKIFVNEHLTPANKQLFKSARTACATAGFLYVWVRNGRVYVRRGDNTPAIHIRNAADLTKISIT